uniref:Sperm associated antigen 17 n=1 Tax=Periophthalmus magnuspinnatus TaxID=409849 RepID=A0A3B3ZP04_9GOBI
RAGEIQQQQTRDEDNTLKYSCSPVKGSAKKDVTEPAKALLDAGGEIPVDLLAKLVKFQLLQIKSSDQQRRQAELLTFGSRVFEDVACLIYDTLDWRRQHQHYLDNLKITDVPRLTAPEPQPPVVVTPLLRSKKKLAHEEKMKPLTLVVDMFHYNKLLDTVPPEACSVPLVLHCMLEQVYPPVPAPPDDTEESTDYNGPFLDQQYVSCLLREFLPLVYAENEKSHLLNSLVSMVATKEEKKVKKSSVLRAAGSYGTLDEFNPVEVEENMMRFSPAFDLIQFASQQKNASCWMATKQQLQYYCTNDVVSWPEVERLFDQSVFESMALTQLDQTGALLKPTQPQDSLGSAQDDTTAIPWDDPLSFAKQQLRRLQNQGHDNRIEIKYVHVLLSSIDFRDFIQPAMEQPESFTNKTDNQNPRETQSVLQNEPQNAALPAEPTTAQVLQIKQKKTIMLTFFVG